MADVKRVYTFGNKEAEGNGKMRDSFPYVYEDIYK